MSSWESGHLLEVALSGALKYSVVSAMQRRVEYIVRDKSFSSVMKRCGIPSSLREVQGRKIHCLEWCIGVVT